MAPTPLPTGGATASVSFCPVASATTDVPAPAGEAALAATESFLATLDDGQRTAVLAERTDEALARWSDQPDPLFDRAGLRMDALTPAQREAVLKILAAVLSPDGYAQVNAITTADGVLAAGGVGDLDLGADHYWISILGTPAATGKWTVQYGGHNLAVNVTLSGNDLTIAPTFWGAQPVSYTTDGITAEPLCGEVSKAFDLVGTFDDDQRAAAVLPAPVGEVVLGPGQDGKTLAPAGIEGAALTDGQRELLLALVEEWLRPMPAETAAAKFTAVLENLDRTTFAWYGDTKPGQPVYYRVQGPTFTVEFAYQQSQDAEGLMHIHSVYREPGNDYGAQFGS
ncbi:DUF3500 domain-containing protein [Saccharothrix violaceirubra]|uniref:DUF3500 domain-containing protein n=1 Tax=Saccharothrix violaceirubra TaxID=413306 RepID=A0A7W7T5J6_9PSEU|nr:DUF3500 domain-containing protein [Saccharothrix violaceirubra]MBB4966955.1 hypothetical protein [Saccharothrix violaceirubra]